MTSKTEFKGKIIDLRSFAFDVFEYSSLKFKIPQPSLPKWNGEKNDYGCSDFMPVIFRMCLPYQITRRYKWRIEFRKNFESTDFQKFDSVRQALNKVFRLTFFEAPGSMIYKWIFYLSKMNEVILFLFSEGRNLYLNELSCYWFEYVSCQKISFEQDGGLQKCYEVFRPRAYEYVDSFLDYFIRVFCTSYEADTNRYLYDWFYEEITNYLMRISLHSPKKERSLIEAAFSKILWCSDMPQTLSELTGRLVLPRRTPQYEESSDVSPAETRKAPRGSAKAYSPDPVDFRPGTASTSSGGPPKIYTRSSYHYFGERRRRLVKKRTRTSDQEQKVCAGSSHEGQKSIQRSPGQKEKVSIGPHGQKQKLRTRTSSKEQKELKGSPGQEQKIRAKSPSQERKLGAKSSDEEPNASSKSSGQESKATVESSGPESKVCVELSGQESNMGAELSGQESKMGAELSGQEPKKDAKLSDQEPKVDAKLSGLVKKVLTKLSGLETKVDTKLSSQGPKLPVKLSGQVQRLLAKLSSEEQKVDAESSGQRSVGAPSSGQEEKVDAPSSGQEEKVGAQPSGQKQKEGTELSSQEPRMHPRLSSQKKKVTFLEKDIGRLAKRPPKHLSEED